MAAQLSSSFVGKSVPFSHVPLKMGTVMTTLNSPTSSQNSLWGSNGIMGSRKHFVIVQEVHS